jgi:hypothetical protein
MLVGRRFIRTQLALFALLVGCDGGEAENADDRGIQQYVDVYCEMMFTCDCTETAFSSEEACRHWKSQSLRSTQLAARGAGLSYDEACLQAHIENIQTTGCDAGPIHREWCSYFHGDKLEGEPCTNYNPAGTGLNDCAQGLSCHGRCWNRDDPDPAFHLEEGATCFQRNEGMIGVCGEGLGCHPETYRCTRIGEPGEACSHPRLCTQGYYCDGSACVPHRGAGEACAESYECESAFVCAEGICEPWPDGPVCMGAAY